MNKLTYIFLLLAGALVFASCSDSTTMVEKIENSPNLVGLTTTNKAVSHIASGEEYQIKLPIEAFGPSVRDLSGDITVTIKPVQSTIPDSLNPAVEGKNFRLDKNTITLKESNNYRGSLMLTMLTKGIKAPVTPPPLVKLKTTKVTGGGNVIASGKPMEITLNYGCDSNIQGVYNVVAVREDGTKFEHKGVTVKQLQGLGKYVTGSIGGFWTTPGSPYRPDAVLNFGVKFTDVCGSLNVMTTGLGGVYSNEVGPDGTTQVNGNSQEAGEVESFTLKYYITFSSQLGYTATYTYVGPLANTSSDNAKIRPKQNVDKDALPELESSNF